MLEAKTQQEAFVDEVLCDLFHGQPQEFGLLLQRDGTKMLRFYWDKAGEKFPREQRINPFGLNFLVREPKRYVTIYLITLPKPTTHGEAYFAALVHRPQRRMLLAIETTSYFSLETVHPEEKPGQTALVEWSHRRQRFKLKNGIEPELEPFYGAVYVELGE